MAIAYCIGCDDAIDGRPAARWRDESVCEICARRVNIALWRVYGSQIRIERRYRRDDTTPEAGYVWLAGLQAKSWAKIRSELGVKPEFPAGLAGFMKEMGW